MARHLSRPENSPGESDGASAKPEARWLRFARRFLDVTAALLLCLLPASAVVGGCPSVDDSSSAFCLAWGGDGGLPALALLKAVPGGGGEGIVLLPGSPAAASSLKVALEERGVGALASLFMPTGAPFPKGARVLLKKFSLRRLLIAEDLRSRTDWGIVMDMAESQGSALVRLSESSGRIWEGDVGAGWHLRYQRLPAGEFRGDLTQDGFADAYRFESRETGEFLLMRVNGGSVTVLEVLPHINRAGCREVPLCR